ncbi:protein cordon-bleu isoform X2 [Rhipicephalus sanguineus]|uniref:protein cordon-bleu isoform X2 n=1 Tax=Rhipicephalus sanguineus TaxID=34632 RepID=UPI0018933FA3|nr:protein cordon-bleu isoform X2 [Rhipicephalus sanguineus]
MAASETSCMDKTLNASVSAPAKQDRSRAKKSAAPAPPRSLVGGPSSSSIGAQQALRATGNGSVVSCPPGATGAGRALSDDCAIDDLLEGRMDLRLVLPDGREVHVNVERRTPVMDLLVQVATAHKINPSGHLVQAPNERGDMLTCKPNTAIGSLDVSHLMIVPKGAPAVSGKVADPAFWHRKGVRPPSKPFEPTQRIQVRLPRQQLMVLRLPLTTTLGELRQNVCTEKNLDPQGYQLVRPGIPTRPLDLGCTLQEYGASEVTLLSNRTLANNIQNSTADIMSYSLNQENKRGSQVFPHHSGSKGSLTGSSSDGASSRGTSPTRSELPTVFARPTSKKRPAPPPPLPASPPPTIPEQEGDTTTLPAKGGRREGAGHSRQSSDSSGYHEASVLSDLPDTPSPEAVQGRPNCNLRQESPSRTTGTTAAVHRRSAPVETGSRAVRPQSTISEAGTIGHAKKRKAPPPPPLALHTPVATQPAPETTKPTSTQPAANPDVSERLAEPSSPAVDEKGEQPSFSEITLLPPPSPFSAPPAQNHLATGNTNQGPTPKPRLLTIPLWQPAPEDNGPSQYDEAALKKLVYSHIDATFDSIEDPDSLAADNSACVSDSASWEYTIPEPPSPFRTRAGVAAEPSAASQSLTKTESPQPGSPKSDLSRDDSGLVEDLGSRNSTTSVNIETQNFSSGATDESVRKCEKKDTSTSVSSVTTTVHVESVVLQETVLCQGSVKALTEEAVEATEKEHSEPTNEGSSSETSSLSVVTSEEPVPSQLNVLDQDQESDESASAITKQPIPRRDSLQIYRLKEVKVSTREADTHAPEKHDVPEPALETSTCKMQEEPPSSVPEEEVFVQTVVVNQGQKGQTKMTVQTPSLECSSSGPSNADAPKGNCTVVGNLEGKSRETSQASTLDRQELVKMSSYPNAAEKTVHLEDIVWEVSDGASPEVKESEASAPKEETRPSQRQDTEKTSRPRSVVGGPISFSIGSLGSYKTEVVDDIYSGHSNKPNYERFKNIKVISPSTASSGAQRAATSKVAAGPVVGSATLTRPDGKQASEGESTFTVKIGSWESDNQGLKQSSKQSVSTADLRPSQSISQVSREAGQLQFEEEKDILLNEYARLQEQFVAWTQQLESNQNLLEDKKIVPSTAAPSAVTAPPAVMASQQPQASSCSTVNGQHEVRVSTLPRVKPVRPLSLVEERSRAFKQPGSSEPMTAPVVSFGTWKDQREDQRVTASVSSSLNRQRAVGGLEGVEEKTSKANKQPEGSVKTVVNSSVKPQAKPKPDTRKPTGILHAAPVVRGFSPEAIEKLSQEVSLQQKLPQSQDQATPHQELPVATSVQQLQSSRPSSKGRVTVTSLHTSSENSTNSQQGSVADRRSLPPYLQSEIVRLAKKPSATSEQHLQATENASCSNNKPSIVQATLKSGVTVEPMASAHSVVKVNGHASAVEVKQAQSMNQPERSSVASGKRPVSECDGPRKVTAGGQLSSQSAARNPQPSAIGTRDILMDEIRNFGGKGSLRKVSTEPAWQLNVCGLRSA